MGIHKNRKTIHNNSIKTKNQSTDHPGPPYRSRKKLEAPKEPTK
jgi:hypothetical protein